jgi:hypothetical protein
MMIAGIVGEGLDPPFLGIAGFQHLEQRDG